MRRKKRTWARGTACHWKLPATRLLCAQGLVRQAEVIECGMDEEEEEDLGTRHSLPQEADGEPERTGGTLLSRLGPGSSGELALYQRGVPSSAFVLVLQVRKPAPCLASLLVRGVPSAACVLVRLLHACHSCGGTLCSLRHPES